MNDQHTKDTEYKFRDLLKPDAAAPASRREEIALLREARRWIHGVAAIEELRLPASSTPAKQLLARIDAALSLPATDGPFAPGTPP